VLLRRIVLGGINASEQHALYRKHTSPPGGVRRSASTANSSTRSGAFLRTLSIRKPAFGPSLGNEWWRKR